MQFWVFSDRYDVIERLSYTIDVGEGYPNLETKTYRFADIHKHPTKSLWAYPLLPEVFTHREAIKKYVGLDLDSVERDMDTISVVTRNRLPIALEGVFSGVVVEVGDKDASWASPDEPDGRHDIGAMLTTQHLPVFNIDNHGVINIHAAPNPIASSPFATELLKELRELKSVLRRENGVGERAKEYLAGEIAAAEVELEQRKPSRPRLRLLRETFSRILEKAFTSVISDLLRRKLVQAIDLIENLISAL